MRAAVWRAGLMAMLAVVPAAAQPVGGAAAIPAIPAGAAACSGCHAPAALGSPVPPLHGRAADDTAAAMQAFRSGARPATVMDRIAKGLSDDEIGAIAAWFAATPEPR